jgi:SAM-dependent methyltransferase
VDYDRVALRAASPTARGRVAFVRSDALRLPIGAQSIDAIICAQVYEHVPDAARLFEEINRVLRPGGLVFFSGPNWLFPVEPHYLLPFLHWLPGRLADAYLRLTRRGDHYYERLYPLWKLRRLAHQFNVQDITVQVFRQYHLPENRGLRWIVRNVPNAAWKLLLPLAPNFNWLLYKPQGKRTCR